MEKLDYQEFARYVNKIQVDTEKNWYPYGYVEESNIPHNMRFKEYKIFAMGEPNRLYVNLKWITQEEFTKKDLYKFLQEWRVAIFTCIEDNTGFKAWEDLNIRFDFSVQNRDETVKFEDSINLAKFDLNI